MSDVYVYVQSKGGKIVKASFEAASAGKRLADALGSKARAIVFGGAQNIADLGKYGVTVAHHVADNAFDNYSQDAFATVIANIAKAGNAKAVLCSATAHGRDLAPRVAAKLDTGYAADITELNGSGGKISAKRPVYAGKSYVNVEIDGVFVASLRPNVFPVTETGGTCAVEKATPGIGRADFKAVVTEMLAATGGKLDVAEAEIIVTGGRGLKGPENWNLIENLASVLGAATGASRAVVDAGWRPHGEQVGQTGKTVSPKLYIAVAVSGAIQHLAGMSSSKVIVAINKDPQAPIFKVANYGIVGDAFEVLPRLTEELKKVL